MKLKRVMGIVVATSLLFSTSIMAYAADATVLQGNTSDAADVEKFEGYLEDNGYTVDYVGFRGSNSGGTIASGPDLRDACNSDVLYWSSHGGNTPVLNLGTNQFNTLDYFTPSSNSPLQIAIFSACRQLDGNTNRQAFAEVMRDSNVRVIASYHEQAPSSMDATLVDHFFIAVEDGNSVRYSWEAANVEVGKSGSWITLNYKDNYNEYYRMPGFKNERNGEYPVPTASTPIYRYWGLSSSSAEVTSSISVMSNANIPLRLVPVEGEFVVDADKIRNMESGANIASFEDMQRITLREPSSMTLSSEIEASTAAQKMLEDELDLGTIVNNAILEEYSVMCAEIKSDGTDGPSELIGKRYVYNNAIQGIPLAGNWISVGVDDSGVYDVIDSWCNVQPDYSKTISSSACVSAISDMQKDTLVDLSSLVYVMNDEGVYELSYSDNNSDGTQEYVSLYELSNGGISVTN